MPVPTSPFVALTAMEQRIDARLRTAPGPRGTFSFQAPDGIHPAVYGEFVRWLLLEAIPELDGRVSHVEIKGITVIDSIDLEGTEIGAQIRFVNCRFNGEINLNDAHVIGFFFISGAAFRILADRLNATGSLEIRKSVTPEPETGAFSIEDRLRLCGAEIRGNLDLRGCVLHGHPPPGQEAVSLFADGLTVKSNLLLADGFQSNGEIRLNGAKIRRNLDCSGATLKNDAGYSLSAAGAQIEGTVYLCRHRRPVGSHSPFSSEGTIRLEGAKIDGDLECSGGTFVAAPFLTPDQPVLPNQRDKLYAIKADGMSVGANLRFKTADNVEFRVRGAISLINATIGDDFECTGGIFDFPGEEIMVADGMIVSGTTFLDRARINGILRFAQAGLKEGLYVTDTRFDPTAACREWFGDDNVSRHDLHGASCGIYAPLAEVGGTFCWQRNIPIDGERSSRYWLYLANSKASIIRDDPASWRRLAHFEINGCQYGALATWLPYEWRLSELDRQYAIENRNGEVRAGLRALSRALTQWRRKWIVRLARIASYFAAQPQPAAQPLDQFAEAVAAFKPQPYLQLAKAFRIAGYENIANNVLVRYQRNKTRYSDFGFLRQVGRWLTDFFLLYGFSPFRPVLFLIIWAVISAIVFELAYLDGKILPAKDLQAFKDELLFEQLYGATPYPPRPRFNALLFSIDTLVPVVDFNQKKGWAIEHIGDRSASLSHGPMSWCDFLWELWRAVPRRGAAFLLVFNTFFGWLLTSFFVAGVGGLLRSGREES